MPTLDFWFDYTCPYAYLASTRVQGVAERMGATLTYQPILLGGIFKAIDQPQKLFASRHSSRIAYDALDMQRWAKRRGVPLVMPPNHPMRSVEALRATLATKMDPKVVAGFYRAYWAENREISTPDVLKSVLTEAGHDAGRVLEEIQSQAIKDDLRVRTERGIGLGLFGVPTFILDGKELYWGQDREGQIEGLKPIERPSVASGKSLDVYWDFSSPFAYLGCAQVEALARRTGATVNWRPILLGGLFKSLGGPEIPLATFAPSKYQWILKDLERWGAYWGVPLKWPSRFPTLSLKALRMYLALPESHQNQYRNTVFKAFWAEDKDIADESVLASSIGDDAVAREALAKMNSDAVKLALRTSTEEAAKRGVFGVPSFFVDGELYWGQDRLELVEDALRA
jgi:2-hydroxychromene-2-carboxylate isomerase